MNIGRMRDRITIQRQNEVTRGSGARSRNWIDVLVRIPADVQPLQNKQTVQDAQPKSTTTHRIRMRYVAGIDPTHRVLLPDAGQVMNITGVIDPTGRREELVIECSQTLPRK